MILIGLFRWRSISSIPSTRFIFCCSTEAALIGGSRLIPSTRPHLLGEVFPHLAERGVPRRPDVFEWTRIFVAREHRGGGFGGRALGEILSGIFEFALEEGISAITAVGEMWWTPRFLEMGWKVEPLGLPSVIAGEPCAAFQFQVDEDVLDNTGAASASRARCWCAACPTLWR